MEGGEREIFQLPLDGVNTEPVGQGSVDLQCFLGFFELCFALEIRDRPHIVEPVGELDDDDANVPAHRHDHLPQRLGLRLFQISGRQVLQLGNTVHDLGQLWAELAGELFLAYLRVLHHVVQERGGHGRGVQTEIRQYLGRGKRMVDKRLATLPGLSPMGRVGHSVGVGHELLYALGRVRAHLFYERRNCYVGYRDDLRITLCACCIHD